MTEPASTTQSLSAISLPAARLSIAAAVAFLLLLAALHFIKPELDPSWRVISEYAIGAHGWMMSLAFFSMALSCVALVIAIRSQVRTVGGKIGLALLLLSAVGMTMAGIFTTDPLTAGKYEVTTHGRLHELGGMLDVVPIAALLISWNLALRNPAWSSVRRLLAGIAGLPLLGLALFIAAVAVMLPADRQFGPNVAIGWPNRLLVVTYCVWLITVARCAIRLRHAHVR